MKRLNNAFITYKGDKFDASALYLFELQWAKEDPNATGDMPRSKQFGYLFTGAAKQGGDAAIYRTIAHELGHGSFSLKHTFDSQYDIAQNSTQNLMDYSAGTDLVKHQWDAIHDPGLVIGMFERDEDGESIAIAFNAEYIVAADNIVSKYFDQQHNKKDIWNNLNSEALALLQTPKGKILFPFSATAGDVQEFLSLIESLWQEHFMTSFLETPNYHPYATCKACIKAAQNVTGKAYIITERGNQVRNKFQGFSIIVEQTFSFILDAAGGSIGATNSTNVIRGFKRSFKLPKAEVSCGVQNEIKFVDLLKKGFINPKKIRFSQSDISAKFKDGSSVSGLTTGLKNGTIDPKSIPPIRIVEKDGLIYTLDNRRLKAFQDAGIEMPYEKLEALPKKELFKFSTTNQGISIKVRGGNYDGN